MAAANGTLTPPSLPPAPTSPSAAKRKLPGAYAIVPNGASGSAPGQSANENTHSLQAVLADILAVLKRYDISRKSPFATRLVPQVVTYNGTLHRYTSLQGTLDLPIRTHF